MANYRIRALGLLSGAFSFAIFAVIYNKNFFHDNGLIATTIIFSATVINLFFQPGLKLGEERDAGNLSAIGVKWYFAIFAALAAFPAPIFVAAKHGVVSAVLALIAIGLMILSQVLSGFTGELVTEIDARINFSSSHLQWADRIEILATQVIDDDVKGQLRGLANDLNFASRTKIGSASSVEERIDRAIDDLQSSLNGSKELVSLKIKGIQNLLSEREVVLRSSRRKA